MVIVFWEAKTQIEHSTFTHVQDHNIKRWKLFPKVGFCLYSWVESLEIEQHRLPDKMEAFKTKEATRNADLILKRTLAHYILFISPFHHLLYLAWLNMPVVPTYLKTKSLTDCRVFLRF